MLDQQKCSLVDVLSQYQIIPVIDDRTRFQAALVVSAHNAVVIRHCDLFEIKPLCQQSSHQGYQLYINTDHMNGIYPDVVGLQHLIDEFSISGIISTNPKVLALGKTLGLETIFHIFVADITGLASAIDLADPTSIDLFDVSPVLVVPSIASLLATMLPRPFIASGLISTRRQVQAVIEAGALGVAVSQPELW